MLIAANGAYKSGSTWLMHPALQLRPSEEPPERCRNKKWKTPQVDSLRGRLLKQFLADPDVQAQNILFKNHLEELDQRNQLLASPPVRLLNIRRDLRDVIVSQYYHWLRDGRVSASFNDFYWTGGRRRAWSVLLFHERWSVSSPQYLRFEYERMLPDFAAEVRRPADVLEVEVTAQRISEIHDLTSPAGMNQHFQFGELNRVREGISGDWVDHFGAAEPADAALLQARSATPPVRLALNSPSWLRRPLARFTRCPRPTARAASR